MIVPDVFLVHITFPHTLNTNIVFMHYKLYTAHCMQHIQGCSLHTHHWKHHQLSLVLQAESDIESDASQSDGKNLSGHGGSESPQPSVTNGRSTSDPETQQLGSSDLAT